MSYNYTKPMLLTLAGLAWACRGEPTPVAAPECPAPQCPACQCPVAQCPEVAPEVAPAVAEAEPQPVPDHLKPSEAQCAAACGKLMEVEVQRLVKRLSAAESGLVEDIRTGMKEEAASLKAECVKRCREGFSTVTTACITRFAEPDRVRECVANAGLAFKPPLAGRPTGPVAAPAPAPTPAPAAPASPAPSAP